MKQYKTLRARNVIIQLEDDDLNASAAEGWHVINSEFNGTRLVAVLLERDAIVPNAKIVPAQKLEEPPPMLAPGIALEHCVGVAPAERVDTIEEMKPARKSWEFLGPPR